MTQFEFVLVLISIVLIAYILTPKIADDERDSKRYYFDNSRWIFSLAAFYFASWAFISCAVLDNPIDEPGSLTVVADAVCTRQDSAVL